MHDHNFKYQSFCAALPEFGATNRDHYALSDGIVRNDVVEKKAGNKALGTTVVLETVPPGNVTDKRPTS